MVVHQLTLVVRMISNETALVKLKKLILSAKTVGQLSAIIIYYTHEEITQAYHQLTSEQQRKIKLIWEEVLGSRC